jgi:tetratricopeptide (TPR) repeat protein
MSRRAVAALAVASMAAVAPARALAADPPAAEPPSTAAEPQSPAARAAHEAYQRGVEHFRQARYADAIAEFNKAYRVDPNPVLVFNMARAFEELKDYAAAVEFYRKYLAMAGDAEDRPQVEQTLRTLELLQAREQGEKLAAAPVPPPARERDDTWAWVAIGGGAALLAGGGFFGWQALGKHDDADSFAADGDEDAMEAAKDDGSRYALYADGLYVAGSAAAITGLVLLLTGDDAAASTATGPALAFGAP